MNGRADETTAVAKTLARVASRRAPWKYLYVIGAQGSIASSRTLVPACGQVLRIRRHEERVARVMSKYYGYEDMRIVTGAFFAELANYIGIKRSPSTPPTTDP